VVERLLKALREARPTNPRQFFAPAHQRLGQSEEARRWLSKAQAWLDQYRDGMPARAEEELGLHYHNWLEAHVLRREAEALLSPH
jgi:hypothetical protein